jgi:hypothetical protein
MKSTRPDLGDEIRAYRAADEEAHQAIMDKLTHYETELQVANAIAREKSGAELALRRQILSLSLAFLTIIVGLVAWVSTEIRDIHRDVAANTAHFREFQAIGIEWGDAIDERAATFRDDIVRIRLQLNEHQQRNHNK